MRRATMPECCATCEHKGVDTEMWADTGRTTERVYCFLDKEHTFETVRDEVLTICERYEPSWGCQQQYRRGLGLPELSSELYPYHVGQQEIRERLRAAYAEVEAVNARNREDERVNGPTLANAGTALLMPERQMRIWRGEPEPEVPKRVFEVWRDGAWVDCAIQDIRKGERFRAWEDAARTESAHRKPEGEVALSDPYQRPDCLWTIEVASEGDAHVCAAEVEP